MRTIGLTGGIGTGKSRVAHWLSEQGFPVLDADKIVHHLFDGDERLICDLKREFGPEIVTPEGRIDRKKLGKLVFDNKEKRLCLERLVHPRVLQALLEEREKLKRRGHSICIWDVPLLFEAGFDSFVDEVWVVWASEEAQIQRVLLRDKLSEEDVLKRISAQMPLSEKCKRADKVIDNSGDWNETEKILRAIVKELDDNGK